MPIHLQKGGENSWQVLGKVLRSPAQASNVLCADMKVRTEIKIKHHRKHEQSVHASMKGQLSSKPRSSAAPVSRITAGCVEKGISTLTCQTRLD